MSVKGVYLVLKPGIRTLTLHMARAQGLWEILKLCWVENKFRPYSKTRLPEILLPAQINLQAKVPSSSLPQPSSSRRQSLTGARHDSKLSNPGTQEAEIGGLCVWGRSRLCNETLYSVIFFPWKVSTVSSSHREHQWQANVMMLSKFNLINSWILRTSLKEYERGGVSYKSWGLKHSCTAKKSPPS